MLQAVEYYSFYLLLLIVILLREKYYRYYYGLYINLFIAVIIESKCLYSYTDVINKEFLTFYWFLFSKLYCKNITFHYLQKNNLAMYLSDFYFFTFFLQVSVRFIFTCTELFILFIIHCLFLSNIYYFLIVTLKVMIQNWYCVKL